MLTAFLGGYVGGRYPRPKEPRYLHLQPGAKATVVSTAQEWERLMWEQHQPGIERPQSQARATTRRPLDDAPERPF